MSAQNRARLQGSSRTGRIVLAVARTARNGSPPLFARGCQWPDGSEGWLGHFALSHFFKLYNYKNIQALIQPNDRIR